MFPTLQEAISYFNLNAVMAGRVVMVGVGPDRGPNFILDFRRRFEKSKDN